MDAATQITDIVLLQKQYVGGLGVCYEDRDRSLLEQNTSADLGGSSDYSCEMHEG